MREILTSIAVGFAITLSAFCVGFANLAMNGPAFIEAAAEMILWPGSAIPTAYWGALHDPIQLGVAVALNVLVYGMGVLALRRGG